MHNVLEVVGREFWTRGKEKVTQGHEVIIQTSAILFIISKRQQQSSDSLHAAKKKLNYWRERAPPKH